MERNGEHKRPEENKTEKTRPPDVRKTKRQEAPSFWDLLAHLNVWFDTEMIERPKKQFCYSTHISVSQQCAFRNCQQFTETIFR